MDNKNIIQRIKQTLASDDRLWADDAKTVLNETKLIDLVNNIDAKVIAMLLENEDLKRIFFVKVKDIYVFNMNDFRFFIEENSVDNSYTQYTNRIGLTAGKRFIKDNSEVVLDFPFKDCVLEGGQSDEEGLDSYYEYDQSVTKTQEKQGMQAEQYNLKSAKRKEVFFNQVLAQDEIDRLFDAKALTGWTRYTADGQQNVDSLKRDQEGTIRENLIIKGNNLLALHSLEQQFGGKVKLIYIDPPYNTEKDGFGYNDKFTHSTWLAFIKNRLEISKKLLREDGFIFIQCDDKEQAYLKILADETFGRDNFISNIIWHKKRGKDNSTSSFSINHDYILVYGQNKKHTVIRRLPLSKETKKAYRNPDNDKRGLYRTLGIWSRQQGGSEYEYTTLAGTFYSKRLWLVNNATMVKLDNDNRLVGNDNNLYYKKFLSENEGSIPETIWLDASNNANAKDEIKALFGDAIFKTPKPEPLIAKIITIATEEKDLVLDFFMGSSTTAAVAHKMGRQYIGIEQMDYIQEVGVERLKKVIAGEQGGISKDFNWQGGGDFIYFELAKWNEAAKDSINASASLDELTSLFDDLYERYFLNYNVKVKEFREKVIQEQAFKALELDEQKQMFLTMLDLNQMYVNYTEMASSRYGISDSDQALTQAFYDDNQ